RRGHLPQRLLATGHEEDPPPAAREDRLPAGGTRHHPGPGQPARLLPPGPAVAPRVLADPAAPRAVAQRVLRGAGAVRRRGAPRKPRPPSAGGTAGGRGRRRDRGPAVDRAGVGGGVARPRRRVRRARRTAVPGVARLPADLPDRAGVPAPEPAAVR